MEQRKTITLSQDFYEALKGMDINTKHEVTDAVFDLFFSNQQPNYNDFSETTRTALACLMPGLRKLQQKFEAGKTEKKFTAVSKGEFCPIDRSKTKRIEAKRSEKFSSDNIYSIYNNIINQSVNQSASDFLNKTRLSLCAELVMVLERIKALAPKLHTEVVKIIIEISTIKNDVEYKINKKIHKTEAVLQQILKNLKPLVPRELQNVLQEIYNRMSNRPKISDTKRYIIASLFNATTSEQTVFDLRPEIPQRDYNQADFDSVFESLDDLEENFN